MKHSGNHTGSAAKHHFTRNLADETATLALGAEIAAILHSGLVIFLSGDLGAGKTTLTRGILRSLGFQGKVTSPTYNLVELYKISRLYFYHFDFYRFNDPIEWEDAGFREYFNADSICLVEWPEKAGGLLPGADLQFLLHVTETGRNVEIQADTEAGRRCLKHWRSLMNP
ncbi:MAG: tRNA (adenosine(37)-N6)-threonylcarbamoyltransferase complex ATPase subunit type 1 TsaE [Nitrosospira sp.]|nr:tRNA (adenosine(37)-N6)-threonylcarbamoyltransferase complex ATPase subunit type 1 TsaE [Nitrosospira sp.]MDN5882122.1 tRNA (adenosine(37)-N6)-threonylcarbamoyltransferase complex ATPase subunit type 1 TsaE [Nitrosospira sp.]MDN5934808.1 tRNA (adenosine(37)-N6)-threonylcarbamoyltransferase complex ATPase subunit type 1 TsaE [Nitrosospira sp.]